MKIQIISDLHQEFGSEQLTFDNADIVVLAGDVNIGIKGIESIKNTIKDKPVIYVLGNHEYYKGSYPKTLNKIRDLAKDTNIHILENESVKIDHVTFHGATLWTDFSLFGHPKEYGIICQARMNDYKKIRKDPSYSKLRTIDTYNIHKASLHWLTQSLINSGNTINFIVTHHAPSPRSIPAYYKNDPISSAYASNLEELILEYQPDYWVHGHIHEPMKYTIGKTQIICNPHGYIDEKYNGYERELLVEITKPQ